MKEKEKWSRKVKRKYENEIKESVNRRETKVIRPNAPKGWCIDTIL